MKAKEYALEIKEINARMRERKTTRAKLIARCREIIASSDLSDAEKTDHMMSEAEHYMDDNGERLQELRAINDLQWAMEDEHTGTRQRPTYCPTRGTWSPSAPPKWVALCKKWEKTKTALIEKVAASINKGKAA